MTDCAVPVLKKALQAWTARALRLWTESRRRSTGVAAVASWLLITSCGDGQANGAFCTRAEACASSMCYLNRCMAAAGDDDSDGLSNGLEQQLRSHPLRPDSDGDGKPDGAEAGAGLTAAAQAADRDLDGKPDVIESALLDNDSDCVPDEGDRDDAVALTDPAALAALLCPAAGVCQQNAQLITATCSASAVRCDYGQVPGWRATELCDGEDDDCDGTTDEGYTWAGVAVGQPCDGVGACGIGVVACQGGQANCSSNLGGAAEQASAEQCNGQDDDCDGLTDEDFALGGQPVGSPCLGTGECGLGAVVCGQAGLPVCSSEPGGPSSGAQPETCNNLDDDCDGQTDEDLTLQGVALGGSCSVPGVCGEGTVVCAKGLVACSTAPGVPGSPASAELCNAKDDDCDGVTDEDVALDGLPIGATCPAKGICPPGVVTCSSTGAATCSTWPGGPSSAAEPESCNGQDDDCDGLTDEDLSWAGYALGSTCPGLGACGAGAVVCGDGGQAVCSTLPGGPAPSASPELCNGLDDDCDGATDEALTPPAGFACVALGVCAGQNLPIGCTAGQWQCGPPALATYQPDNEWSCDGLDNDCDGLTDEGLPKVWAATASEHWTAPAQRLGAAVASGAGQAFLLGGVSSAAVAQSALDTAAPSGALWLRNSWLSAPAHNDVWAWNSESAGWTRLASGPQLARVGAAVLMSGAPQRLWVVGGLGGPPAVEVDVASSAVGAPDWPVNAGLPPVGPALAAQAEGWPNGFVLTPGDLGVEVLRVDLASGAWTKQVAQPTLAGLQATCRSVSGWVYALGEDAAGQARFLAWKPPAANWQTRPDPPVSGDPSARLWCDARADEVWLISHSGWWRWSALLDGWQALDAGALSGVAGGVLVPVSGAVWHWLLATGPAAIHSPLAVSTYASAGGSGSSIAIAGQTLLDGPPPAAVAMGVAQPVPDGPQLVVLSGGAQWTGKVWAPVRGAWWRSAGKPTADWQYVVQPFGLTARIAPHMVWEPQGLALQVWGGIGTALEANQLTGASGPLESGGARLDLLQGTWSALDAAELAALPTLRPYAALVATAAPGTWYGFGASPDGVSQLWRIQVSGAAPELIWQSGQGPGPQFVPGAALAWSEQGQSLHVATPAGSDPGQLIQRWQYVLGPKASWQSLSALPAVPGSRVALVARPDDPTLLVLTDAADGTTSTWLWPTTGTQKPEPWSLQLPTYLGAVIGAEGGAEVLAGYQGSVLRESAAFLPLGCQALAP